jgi:hypothetical protein
LEAIVCLFGGLRRVHILVLKHERCLERNYLLFLGGEQYGSLKLFLNTHSSFDLFFGMLFPLRT